MKKSVYLNEDLTPTVKRVIKEQEERDEAEFEAGSGDIADIAGQMGDGVPEDDFEIPEDDFEASEEDDFESEGESEDMNVTFEFDALVNLVGEESAQKLYDLCCEKGPSVPLTVDDVEECCPTEEFEADEEFEVGDEEDVEGFEEAEDMAEEAEDMAEDAEGMAEEAEEMAEAGEEEAEAGCDAMGTGDIAAGAEVDEKED